MKRISELSVFAIAAMAVAFPVFADQTAGGDREAGYAQQNSPAGMDDGQDGTVTRKANNTGLNARDRGENSVTPLDQGTSREDIDSTAAIRKGIMAREGISVDAQNVKVITQSGKVTLRGPVRTAEEKSFIYETASHVAGAANVNDQLEVVNNS